MRNKSLGIAIKTYHLIIDSKYILDLSYTFYIPKFSQNLIYSDLNDEGYTFYFAR